MQNATIIQDGVQIQTAQNILSVPHSHHDVVKGYSLAAAMVGKNYGIFDNVLKVEPDVGIDVVLDPQMSTNPYGQPPHSTAAHLHLGPSLPPNPQSTSDHFSPVGEPVPIQD